ncbi:MAG: DNA mismatch repair protein MutS [Limisphaerales bacterium]|jgi:DNA mismatch repair protein MutS
MLRFISIGCVIRFNFFPMPAKKKTKTASKVSPMMAQYRAIKSELPPEALLFFRLGDFYEMFFDDAKIGAEILNVRLTMRGTTPMCGVPYHAAEGYIARALKAGRIIAICEQVETAIPGKLVKRDVTQIISPGTHFDERMLTAEKNNYLAAVCECGGSYGLAVVDLTTSDFKTTETELESELLAELERLRPAEIIFPSQANRFIELLETVFPIVNGHEDWVFAPETAVFTVREHFGVASLDGFGLKNADAAVGATGAALHYLAQHLRRDVKHLTRLSYYQCRDYLVLDSTTLRNLEILEPLHRDAPRDASLFGAMNRTTTPMGARRLRDWLSQPLAAVEPIRKRQLAVQSFLDRTMEHEEFRNALKSVRDLERTLSRLSIGSGNARDLVGLRQALQEVPGIRELLARIDASSSEDALIEEEAPDASPSLLSELSADLSDCPELTELIQTAVVDEPPLALKDGGIVRDGYDAALDELRSASTEGKNWIAKLKQAEIERTGVPNLKIAYNAVFGYFIEITKSHLDKVPDNYTRKQTVANAERFITPELKEMEGKILGAEERSTKLEYDLFLQLREQVIATLPEIQRTASALAQLDVLAGFAETARLYEHSCPQVGDEGVLDITDGRHPVLDQTLVEERFVPNDTQLDRTDRQIALITGPNMAGKSTYIRQVALLALLSHTGSFIPAARARVDLVDRIFTRVGASDDLSRGQSTFMVEMSETANILNNASQRSLVILDEIGRGTSTFDGLSLAWSIVEFLHNQAGCKTLFATHYHELTELAGRLGRLKNFNVAVREWNDQIIFLRKIVEGGTDKSYGIHVARLAGVPKEVLERAKVILNNLEDSELTPEGNVRQKRTQRAERDSLKELAPSPQMDLFN